MLLCGVINELEQSLDSPVGLAYFFCQATDVRLNSAQVALRGLVFRLLKQNDDLARKMRKRYGDAGMQSFDNSDSWDVLCDMLISMVDDPSMSGTVLIVDALDECVTGLQKLLELVVKLSHSQARVLVSSRNRPDIESGLSLADTRRAPICLELNAEAISAAVGVYIDYEVELLAKCKNCDQAIKDSVRQHLKLNSNNTFLWVALVCQKLRGLGVRRRHIEKTLKEFPPGLDDLYERMAELVFSSEEDVELCRHVLALMVLAYRPVSSRELFSYLKTQLGLDDFTSMQETVETCGSFLTLRNGVVYFVHQSAKDFLLSKRAGSILPRGYAVEHSVIASWSIDIMENTLRENIYSLPSPGCIVDEITRPEPDPLGPARYACVYWVDHLSASCGQDEYTRRTLSDNGPVHNLLTRHFLHWLEALSLLKEIPAGIVALLALESLVSHSSNSYGIAGDEDSCRDELAKLIHDAWRFVRYYKAVLDQAPLQVYSSGMVFSPAQSLVRRLFYAQRAEWIKTQPETDDEWDPCLQTLEGHTGIVNSVAFSLDGKRIISASKDRTLKIWDTTTGACQKTLQGHNDDVTAVAISLDGKQVVSASWEGTIKLWDFATGTCQKTFEEHYQHVTSLAFSPDGSQLASVSVDMIVTLRDLAGNYRRTLDFNNDNASSMALSVDGRQLLVGLHDGTAELWDLLPPTPTHQKIFKTHRNAVLRVAISRNGQQIATVLAGDTVVLWDTGTGAYLRTIKTRFGIQDLVTFSPDARQIATTCVQGARGKVEVCDAVTGAHLNLLEGHSGPITAVTFSADGQQLATASADTTVKLWNPMIKVQRILNYRHYSITTISISPQGCHIASASDDCAVKLWDAVTGGYQRTLSGHRSPIKDVTFSPDGQQVASASFDCILKIWDVATGKCQRTLECRGWIRLVAFSGDGQQIASVTETFLEKDPAIVELWDVASGQRRRVLFSCHYRMRSLAFSPDMKHIIATYLIHSQTEVWDIATETLLNTVSIEGDNVALAEASQISSLSVHGAWIMRNSERLLWLPQDYRPGTNRSGGIVVAAGLSVIALGCSSGRVIVLRFAGVGFP